MDPTRDPQAATAAETAGPSVLVLGGTGFIGRHAVAALAARGCSIVIGSRKPSPRGRRAASSAGPQQRRVLNLSRLLTAAAWHEHLSGIEVVVNCVGILRQRGRETYARVHHLAPAALAAACRERGIRLIHVSALGLEGPARSRFVRSKRDGEAAIRASGADWLIVRPSLLDGEGGYGARWLRRISRWPVHPVPADARGKIAALDVRDLGEALARLARAPATGGIRERELDLGGLASRTLAEHLLALRRLGTPNPAWPLKVPAALARLASHLCDLLRLTPFSFGHWELLRRDNRPAVNRLPDLLGRAPRPVGRPWPSAAPPRTIRSQGPVSGRVG